MQEKFRDAVNQAGPAGTRCINCSERDAVVTVHPCGHKVTCSGVWSSYGRVITTQLHTAAFYLRALSVCQNRVAGSAELKDVSGQT